MSVVELYTHECWYPQRPEEGVTAGVTGSCEPLNVGIRDWILVLCKKSVYSELPTHLSRPNFILFLVSCWELI